MENFSRSIARCAAGQIVDAAGFEAVQESALDMLTELILRYISEVGSASHAYAELAGRTDTNALDVMLVLEELGMDFEHLKDYVENEPENPFNHPLPKYPIQAQPRHAPTFQEMGEKPPSHIPAFLPAFPDERTYKETPVFATRKQDKTALRKKQVKGRQEATKALLSLNQRINPGAPVNYKAADKARWGHIDLAGNSEKSKDGAEINPFLSPPVWEDQLHNRGVEPKKDTEKAAVELGASGRALEEMLAKRSAGGDPGANDAEGSGLKKQKAGKAGRAEGPAVPSFTLDWESKMERASNSLNMLNHASRNSGFDSAEPIKDKDKLKAQERAETILRMGPAAVTMDLDDK